MPSLLKFKYSNVIERKYLIFSPLKRYFNTRFQNITIFNFHRRRHFFALHVNLGLL